MDSSIGFFADDGFGSEDLLDLSRPLGVDVGLSPCRDRLRARLRGFTLQVAHVEPDAHNSRQEGPQRA
jgi:hypothetical protein